MQALLPRNLLARVETLARKNAEVQKPHCEEWFELLVLNNADLNNMQTLDAINISTVLLLLCLR